MCTLNLLRKVYFISYVTNEIIKKYGNLKEFLKAIKESIDNENLTQKDRETVDELVVDIASKIKEKRKPNQHYVV